MYVKAIKYTDYNGNEKVKNFYFNYNKSELAKMQLKTKGDVKELIKKMINEDDNKRIVEFFEEIVLGAYGEKSADGEEFMKSDEIRQRFMNHPAYDVLFMELIEGGDKAMSDFIKAVIPQNMADSITDKETEATIKELVPSV